MILVAVATACCLLLVLLTLIAGVVISRLRYMFSTGLGEPELLAYFTGYNDINTGSYANLGFYRTVLPKAAPVERRAEHVQCRKQCGITSKNIGTRSDRKSSYTTRKQHSERNARAMRNREREHNIKQWMNVHNFPSCTAGRACASDSPILQNYYYPNIIFSPSVLSCQSNSFSEDGKSTVTAINQTSCRMQTLTTSSDCYSAFVGDETGSNVCIPVHTSQHVTVIHVSDTSANLRSYPTTPLSFRPQNLGGDVSVSRLAPDPECLGGSLLFCSDKPEACVSKTRQSTKNDQVICGAGNDVNTMTAVVDGWEMKTSF